MSKRKWTPGPWKWADDRDKTGLIYLRGVLIAEHTDGTPWGDDIDRANAHLIAAAPELYEGNQAAIDSLEFALRELTHNNLIPIEDVELMRDRIAALKASAAKARGEQ